MTTTKLPFGQLQSVGSNTVLEPFGFYSLATSSTYNETASGGIEASGESVVSKNVSDSTSGGITAGTTSDYAPRLLSAKILVDGHTVEVTWSRDVSGAGAGFTMLNFGGGLSFDNFTIDSIVGNLSTYTTPTNIVKGNFYIASYVPPGSVYSVGGIEAYNAGAVFATNESDLEIFSDIASGGGRLTGEAIESVTTGSNTYNETASGGCQVSGYDATLYEIYDDFNRANNTSSIGTPSDGGPAWEVLTGTLGIISNQLYANSNGAAVRDLGSNDGRVSVVVGDFPFGVINLSFRRKDLNTGGGALQISKSGGVNTAAAGYYHGGFFQTIRSYTAAEIGHTIVTGDTIDVHIDSQDVFRWYINGNQVYPEIAANTQHRTGTKYGFFSNSTNAKLDSHHVFIPTFKTWSQTTSGGSKLSGSATVDVIESSGDVFNETAEGGCEINGTALDQLSATVSSSGGIITTGASTEALIYAPSIEGGVVCSGSSTHTLIYAPSIEGGVVVGGSATTTYVRSNPQQLEGTVRCRPLIAGQVRCRALLAGEINTQPVLGGSVAVPKQHSSRLVLC